MSTFGIESVKRFGKYFTFRVTENGATIVWGGSDSRKVLRNVKASEIVGLLNSAKALLNQQQFGYHTTITRSEGEEFTFFSQVEFRHQESERNIDPKWVYIFFDLGDTRSIRMDWRTSELRKLVAAMETYFYDSLLSMNYKFMFV